MSVKSPEDEIESRGREAFEHGIPGSECPYAYNKSPFWDTKDQDRFDREWRWKLDAWMRGWISAQRASKSAIDAALQGKIDK